jgi:hypothetical protein
MAVLALAVLPTDAPGKEPATKQASGSLELALPERSPTIRLSEDRLLTQTKLAKIILPTVDLKEVPFSEALEQLSLLSVPADTAEKDPVNRGVLISRSWAEDEGEDARVTLSLSNVPLGEALKELLALADHTFEVRDRGVMVLPNRGPDVLLHEEWELTQEMASALSLTLGGNAMKVLAEKGIPFPPGSSAIVSKDANRLSALNTRSNNEQLDSLLTEIRNSPPAEGTSAIAAGDPLDPPAPREGEPQQPVRPNEMLTKGWPIDLSVQRVLNLKTGPEVKSTLEANGVRFPAGSAAFYMDASNWLIMRNTRANLEVANKLIEQAMKEGEELPDLRELAP